MKDAGKALRTAWQEYAVCEIGTVVGGGTPSTKNDNFYDGGIPWITPKDLANFHNRYIYRGERSISVEGYNNSSAQMLPAGSVLFSSRAPIGYIAIAGQPVCTNQGFKSVVPDPRVCESEFLYYLLSYYRFEIEAIASGTTFLEVSGSALKNFRVELPPLDIQKKISSVLTSLDDKIELNTQINHNLEEQAKAIFKSWIEHCRHKTFIGDIVTNILDYTPNQNSRVVLINSSDVTQGHFEHHLLSDNKNLKGHFKKRFQKFDILFSEIRPRNKHYAYVLFCSDQYIASTRLMVLRNKPDKISSSLLYQYLISDDVCENFTVSTETRSGTFPQGCFEDLAKISIPIDSLAKQGEVTHVLNGIYEKMYILDKENNTLSMLRDTLLPKLMSGEIDVSEVEV